jgi:hypothetical protein
VPFLLVESDWRATNPRFTPTISPNISNQNFEIAILFSVVQRSGNYVFEDEKEPATLRAGVVSFDLGAYKDFIESVVVASTKRAHLIGN